MADQTVTAESAFPSETIDLPSKGMFYPENSPLRSGQIDLYYMTAKHEDILTSTNLLQKGVVLDRLIDALIATKGVKSADLLIGDLNAVMIAARILGYGKNYTVSMTCPKCGTTSEQTIDLTTLTNTNEPTSSARREMSVVLPLSKAEVVMRLLTRGDEAKIDKEVQALKKVHGDVNKEATTRLKHIIVSVNGDTSKTKIWEFVENMFVQDSRYLREQYKNFLPDVNFDVPVECECGASETARLPIGVNFFWPDARV